MVKPLIYIDPTYLTLQSCLKGNLYGPVIGNAGHGSYHMPLVSVFNL